MYIIAVHNDFLTVTEKWKTTFWKYFASVSLTATSSIIMKKSRESTARKWQMSTIQLKPTGMVNVSRFAQFLLHNLCTLEVEVESCWFI